MAQKDRFALTSSGIPIAMFHRLTITMSIIAAQTLTTVVTQNTGRKFQSLIVRWKIATPAMAQHEPTTLAQVT